MESVVYCFIILCIGVVYGQKCCFPDKWHGTESLTFASATENGQAGFYFGYANISVDASLQAVYADELIYIQGGTQQRIKVLQMYSQNMQYSITGGECYKQPLPGWSEANHCIPDKSLLMNTFNVGEIPVTEYTFGIPSINSAALVAVTKDCIPITEKVFGNVQKVDFIMFVTFGDIKPGIPDPSVFNVPDICKKAALETDFKLTSHRRRRAIISP